MSASRDSFPASSAAGGRRGSIDSIMALLAARGHDFRDYRRDLLERRVAERMAILGEDDPDAYAARVAGSEEEAASLAETILITTTRFFRHPATFDAIERLELPPGARAWVAGVSTGEEAWSLAMVREDLEILASDASARAIAHARSARYRRDDVPTSQRRHVIERGDEVEIAPPLRARVRFARHDLLGPQLAPAEAVVARFELVLCRNVLIYLTPRLQERLLDRLAAAVAPGGVLGLGPYEAVHRPDLAPIGAALWRKR